MGEAPSRKTSHHKPPSRIRYEKENPLLSIRIPREYHEKVKDYGIRRCGSLSKYLKQCVDIQQTLVAMSIETLRKFFKLPANIVDELYSLYQLKPSSTHVAKSFSDLGLDYTVQTNSGMKLNIAICLAYLFLCGYGGVGIKKIASITNDSLDKARKRIVLAATELLRIFYRMLINQMHQHLESMCPLEITDIMAMIMWSLIHSVDLKALAPIQKPSNRTQAPALTIDPKALQGFKETIENIKRIVGEIKEIAKKMEETLREEDKWKDSHSKA